MTPQQYIIAGIERACDRTGLTLEDKIQDIGLDSLDMMEMLFELEVDIDSTIDLHRDALFNTVGDLVAAIEPQLRATEYAKDHLDLG